jgi:hypothetical protein
MAAAARHVAAMTEEMPEHHAAHREQQPNHQTDSVNDHKPSLNCLSARLKNQSPCNASRKGGLDFTGSFMFEAY